MGTLPVSNQLGFLEISHSDLGDAGLAALLESSLPNLERLVLQDVGITDVGAGQLLSWEGLARLQWLDVSGNALSDDTVAALRDHLGEGLRVA